MENKENIVEGENKEAVATDGKEVVKEETKKTFKLFSSDQEYTDPLTIDYLKICLREFTDANHLIGKFNDDGKYFLEQDIKRELVNMEKEISELRDGVFFAENNYLFKNFSFKVVTEKISETRAKATLYLLENYKDGYEEGMFTTFVASFEADIDSNLNPKVRTVFNLVDSSGDLSENDIPNLAVLLQGQQDNGIFLDELIELGSQIYVLRMLELLENAGEKGKEILEAFKKRQEELEKIEEGKEKPEQKNKSKKNNFDYKPKVNKKYTNLRKILDKTIQEKGGIEKLPIKKEDIQKNLKDFVEPVKKVENLRKSYKNPVVEKQAGAAIKKAPDKAKSSSKNSQTKSSSSSSKTAGGSSPKKKSAKKDGDKKKDKKKDKGKDKKGSSSGFFWGNGSVKIIEETKVVVPADISSKKDNALGNIPTKGEAEKRNLNPEGSKQNTGKLEESLEIYYPGEWVVEEINNSESGVIVYSGDDLNINLDNSEKEGE